MITIAREAWETIAVHLEAAYPKEGCGILLGTTDDDRRQASTAEPCRNIYQGEQADRFQLDPLDILAADRRARELGIDVIGFFHSHPDCDAYFSATDLANSWPWYSNVVVSVRAGKVHHAAAFIANDDQTQSTPEDLNHPEITWQKY